MFIDFESSPKSNAKTGPKEVIVIITNLMWKEMEEACFTTAPFDCISCHLLSCCIKSYHVTTHHVLSYSIMFYSVTYVRSFLTSAIAAAAEHAQIQSP